VGSPYGIETACCSRGGLTKKNERKSVYYQPLVGKPGSFESIPRRTLAAAIALYLRARFPRKEGSGFFSRSPSGGPGHAVYMPGPSSTIAQALGLRHGGRPRGYNSVIVQSQRGGKVPITKGGWHFGRSTTRVINCCSCKPSKYKQVMHVRLGVWELEMWPGYLGVRVQSEHMQSNILPQSTYTQQLRVLFVYLGDLIRPGASKGSNTRI